MCNTGATSSPRALCVLQFMLRSVYGEAFLVADRATGKRLVIKHVSLERVDQQKHVQAAVDEVSALNLLCHPNIVRCHGSWVMPGTEHVTTRPWDVGTESLRRPVNEALKVWKEWQNETSDKAAPSLNILTEWIDGGSLDRLIQRNNGAKPLDEDLVGIWSAQLVLAIDHMHKSNLLHRDIKVRSQRTTTRAAVTCATVRACSQPANVFITESGIIKLGDLGCCKMLENPDEACTNEYGSPQYLSPEVWQYGIHTHKSDIWSVGCVIYELLSFAPPFKQPSLMHCVLTAHPAALPVHYSAGLSALVLRLLHKDPNQRPSSTELLQDAVITHHVKRWLAASRSVLGTS